MRYRYRIEPTPAQQRMLARTFGCCRVVFNDALRIRDEAYQAGVKLSDSEIQRRVITQAKTTEQRGWLAEVPSVALVQSVNDSRRAWRNFFDSHTGIRKGHKVGRPRMKSKKDHRQSFRLTRNGFRVRGNGRLFVAKMGEVRVRWSPRSTQRAIERHGHSRTGWALLRQLRRRRTARPASARRARSRRGRGDHQVGNDRRQRWPAYGYREPETSGSRATETTPFGAGEVPPAERHLTKLKVKPRAGEEVETPGVRRRAGRFAGSGGVGRGIC